MENSTYRLYVYDALSGKLRVSSERFMTIGSGDTSTFRVEMKVRTGGTFAMRDNFCRFFPHGLVSNFSINGTHPARDVRIRPCAMYLFTLAGACFVCWFGPKENIPDFNSFDITKWYVYDLNEKSWSCAYTLPDLCRLQPPLNPDDLVAFEGMSHCAFPAKDIMEASRFASTLGSFKENEEKGQEEPVQERPMRCPFCWGTFDEGEILAIAAQPQLKGDKLLGENAMRRFKPIRYNGKGLPLDESGAPCRGAACPHCHSKLPPFFSELRPHVISLSGVRGAGKTYYLTTLINEAVRGMSRDFDASFRDIAPELNALLNRRRQQLFAATTPEQAYLEPTRTTAPYYNRVWKDEHFANLPVPMLYGISRQGATCSILTYDNAGSDFERETAEDTDLVTGHFDAADAVFFLFDPTQSTSFNRILHKDEGDHTRFHASRQAPLINDLDMQLRMRFNQPPPAKLPIPIAFVMTKLDAWRDLLGPEPLLPVVHNGRLMPSCIHANSKRLRQLIFNISPQLCVSAEALSGNVCYFAVSSFGKEPVRFEDHETGEILSAPESGSTQPEHVMDPLLWVLNQLEPRLLPKNN